jgi:uncharacterized protein (TIGR02001 family)
MKKSVLAVLTLAVAGLFSAAAHADGLSANVSLVSKYKYRGQDQSDATKDAVPALQGGFDYTLGGFYVGNWNSAIGGFANGTEMDFYGGYKGKVSILDYDVGVLQYYYPGTGGSTFNTTEVYGQLGWEFITAKYSVTVSDKYFGFEDGDKTGYLDIGANYEIVKGLTLNAHVGQTFYTSDAKNNPVNGILLNGSGPVNYTDYKLGLTYDLGNGFSVSGAAVGANKKNVWGDANKSRLILALSKSM